MTKELFTKQLDSIISDFNIIKGRSQHSDLSGSNIGENELTAVLTRAKAAVSRIVTNNSEYYKDISEIMATREYVGTKLKYIIGVVQALKFDIENDYLKTFQELVQSELFSDYLEMAEYLESENYKDPAAVIVGSTLESHLRTLCKSHGIDTEFVNSKGKNAPKKAEVINADLSKAGIYSLAYQKQITAWFDIRNSAAHGHYNDYSNPEVKLMLQGVRQFILTHN